VQFALTARTGFVLGFNQALDPFQVGRQVAAVEFGRRTLGLFGDAILGLGVGGGSFGLGRGVSDRRGCGCDILFGPFKGQLELVGINPLGLAAELSPLELPDHLFQPGSFLLGFGKGGVGLIKGDLQAVATDLEGITLVAQGIKPYCLIKRRRQHCIEPGIRRFIGLCVWGFIFAHGEDYTNIRKVPQQQIWIIPQQSAS
jgi:hypothetical protein